VLHPEARRTRAGDGDQLELELDGRPETTAD
jgi:hypothetical protein